MTVTIFEKAQRQQRQWRIIVKEWNKIFHNRQSVKGDQSDDGKTNTIFIFIRTGLKNKPYEVMVTMPYAC
jgi:hypothetical protein